ncbi:uncharacterized protein LOC127081390 [Lathyrus oleraceus]|uniref:uncharacterized protein LOC127081390 n=1 Tax=Pisum sativum TaxID=3888 RepID=UPI0021D23EAD|nr:uncharacterized protein LOC127081390 [Pisum sativum]
MVSEKERDNFCVRFTGKNYSAWEFQFKMYVRGKGLWSHLDDVSKAPAEKTALDVWETKDAQIITWILNSIDPQMINNLRSFSTAQEMWNYLKRIYNQDNSAKRFQLELDIANYKQGDLSIQEYYSGFLNLWTKHSAIIHAKVPKTSLAVVQEVYNTSGRDQFLMKLRSEFEVVRGALLNRNHVPSLDTCVGELLREEQRLITQGVMSHDAVSSKPVAIAYAAQSRGKGCDMRQVQCFSCKQFGHIARSCSKNTGASNSGVIQPEMIQQMVHYALSALGIQGKSSNVSQPWFLDSGASNHMTGSSEYLHNLHSYNGNQQIQIADGNKLTITDVGDINSNFRDVLEQVSGKDWHRKSGHPNSVVLSHLFKTGLLGIKHVCTASISCSVCKLAKSKTLPFPSGAHRASTCFEMIHSDVWGMSPAASHAHYKYFVTFIDDYSRFTWIYFLRSKSEVFSMFQKFLTYVETQFQASVKIFRSDSGGEYMSHEFQEYLQQKGILSQRYCPNTP